MPAASLPEDEQDRLRALRGFEILDTPSEQAFDDLTLLAAAVCNTPMSLVSLVDANRQWFKSKVGVDVTETPRDLAFCAHAILEPNSVMVVPDAREDDRFAQNPFVTAAEGIRFYAGAPITTTSGHVVGTLCVLDRTPRTLDERQLEALRALSRQARAQLDLRSSVAALRRTQEKMARYERELEAHQLQLERANAALESQSMTDPLTGLYNRRALSQQLGQALADSQRRGEPVSLLLIDVDHFKEYNDAFGHPAGDETLSKVGQVLLATARTSDICARYGGEEFAVLLPHTREQDAALIAERFRAAIESADWTRRAVTISVGVATRSGSDARCEVHEFIADADAGLYAAKSAGRNRVKAGRR